MTERIITLIGYHGTAASHSAPILSLGFKPSIGDAEWLGNGTYFFVEGLSHVPEAQAQAWAIAQAWNNSNKAYAYKEWVVLEASISVHEDHFLDLTTPQGQELFHETVTFMKKKIKKVSTGKPLDYIDGLVINLMRKEIFDIQAVKGHFYIKFAFERKNRIQQRMPNCTICAVSGQHCIENVKKHSQGSIKTT